MTLESQIELDENRAAFEDTMKHYQRTGVYKDSFTCDDYQWNWAMREVRKIRQENIEYEKRKKANPQDFPVQIPIVTKTYTYHEFEALAIKDLERMAQFERDIKFKPRWKGL